MEIRTNNNSCFGYIKDDNDRFEQFKSNEADQIHIVAKTKSVISVNPNVPTPTQNLQILQRQLV